MQCFEYLRFKATPTPSMFTIAKLPGICLFNVCLTHREYRVVLCNDDLPVTILDRVATSCCCLGQTWAGRLGRTLGPKLLTEL